MRTMGGRRGALALAFCVAVTASTTSGCSFLLVDAPPPNAGKLRGFNCTVSNTWPTIDVVAGGILAIDGVAALTNPTNYNDGGSKADYVAAGTFLAAAALLATSAAVGYRRTSDCREATTDLMMRLYPPGAAPTPGFAPYPPQAPPAPYDPWAAPSQGAPPPQGLAPPAAGAWDPPLPAPASAPAPAPASDGGAPR